MTRFKQPAVVVGGLRSGVGKTTVTLGLIRALADSGKKVAAFKVGPDFLDPGHYQAAGAVFVRNLDPILQTEAGMLRMFGEAEKYDAAVVEGVMGLFDGPFPQNRKASTAAVAETLGLPVLLVCDARSCAQSIAAEIIGAMTLLGHVRQLAGVVFNFVGSPRHAELLVKGVKNISGIGAPGCIFRDSLPHIPSRHLGLVSAAEMPPDRRPYAQYGKIISNAVRLDALCRRACRLRAPRPIRHSRESSPGGHTCRFAVIQSGSATIAIARDAAFSFYYPETIDYFRRRAARVVFFSPLKDKLAPPADLYYFGGGFPEVYAQSLSKNSSFRASLRARLRGGAKAYAECGGLMYLTDAITTSAKKSFPMVGFLPGICVMHNRRQILGYWKARVLKDALFLKKNMTLIGHEYHWSRFDAGRLRTIYAARKIGATARQRGGWRKNNVFASYLHLSPLGNPTFFSRLVDWCSIGKSDA